MKPQLYVVSSEFGAPAKIGATNWDKLTGRLREWLGRFLNWSGTPGIVQPFDYHDLVTGNSIQIVVSPLFTRLSVNGRDYYFRRVSGQFDGTGMGCI